MKQFIIALKSTDFIKSGKNWTTDYIDLYHNRWYTNYSNYRSRYGIDYLGNKVFVGTEIIPNATPSISVEGSTPIAVTNYGEIIQDTNVIKYNIFEYDEISGQYYIFDLIESTSPFFILDDGLFSPDLLRFIDTTAQIDIISYKRSILKRINSRCSDLFGKSI